MNGNSKRVFAILLFSFAIINNSLFSQNLRVVYDYEYIIDSLNQREINQEIMILDIVDASKSYFYSHEKFIYDSIMNSKRKEFSIYSPTNNNFTNITDKSNVNFAVTKNYLLSEKKLHLKLDSENYAIRDEENISWQIENEKKEIRGLKVQKATTKYIGRKWVAWFCADYPFSDGPYKLEGLPGLILEAYDESNSHTFKLLGIKNITNQIPSQIFKSKELEIDNIEFNKLWKDYKNDPAKSYRNRMLNSNVSYSISMNGINNPQEIIKQIEKSEKLKLKKFNNFIELDLFK